MGSTPTTTNAWTVFFDGLVNAAIVGGEDAMQSYILTTPFAWLESPIISIITNFIFSQIGSSIYSQAKNLVAMAVIDVQTNLEKSAVASAVTNLKLAQAGGDQNAIANANAQFDAAAANLIHWDGSTPSGS